MANTIKGRIHKIMPLETKEVNGNVYYSRKVIINATTYDMYTGEERGNFPQIEFSGATVNSLEYFNIGDPVEVSFFLMGKMYINRDNEESNFTSVRGFKIEKVAPREQVPIAPTSATYSAPTTSPAPAPGCAPDLPPMPTAADAPAEIDDLPF